ncbi:HTH domain-containing protein [Anseongella ginsenosidimutans]|uniref:HTH domain-containing protein n=1 Tax=Anseongella ginsenosidimutans TaxID=496056 RepID=A0A4R3KRB0_9SPHI|nr:YafY family protein [Anseongella ginsenosidimutans]QEC52337.1 YafY family transcriptional regulator [Anseongella ginsenosidimutans]TCS86903.1 HTH domain-containing protein [Anseongella ginsenosidimutans]
MNRIDRLFGILILLQSKKHASVEWIAGKFRISERTVYRDLKALTELGIPLSFEPYKGYCIVQGYFLPPVSFSSEEANALLLMETVASGFADKSIREHYTNALNKVKAVLRTSQKDKLEILAGQIKIQLPASYQHDFEYLSELQEAISSREIIEIDYKNTREEQSKRQAEPLGLIFYAFNWHLVAWCHLRSGYRDFRVSRILKVSKTGLPFRKTDHIDLNDYMKTLPVDF